MIRTRWMGCFGAAAILVGVACAPALADETVNVGGSRAVLIMPKGPPNGSIVLLPGGDGAIRPGENGEIRGLTANQLVRTRYAYAARGLAVFVADTNTDLKGAVEYMAAIKRPVIVAGTSNGTIRAAQGITRGARPDTLVLTSGLLSSGSGTNYNVMSILGSPASLPRTLVIHHEADACRATLPAGVDPFIKWSAGRARVTWVYEGQRKVTHASLGHITALTAWMTRLSGLLQIFAELSLDFT